MGTGYEQSARGDADWMAKNTANTARSMSWMDKYRNDTKCSTPVDVLHGLATLNLSSILSVSASAVQLAEDLVGLLQTVVDELLAMQNRPRNLRHASDLLNEFTSTHSHHDAVKQLILYARDGGPEADNLEWCVAMMDYHDSHFHPEKRPVILKIKNTYTALRLASKKLKVTY